MRGGARAGLAAVLALGVVGCGGTTRFALRAPVTRVVDQPMPHPPEDNEESDYANTLDTILFRPISHAFLFQTSGEARDVNAMDEVPDSAWFQNRTVAPGQLVRGTCPDVPTPPFLVKNSKTGGTTPGMVVVDARGQKYVLKVDELDPRQPEMATAADAIVSRLYWAVGFNAPCNDVIYVPRDAVRIGPRSVEVRSTGRKVPLTRAVLDAVLARATRGVGGELRLGASRFIGGKGVGTWRTEGTRGDDPNDRIPHEDRRELRGEKLLAAWTDHWDSRGLNTYDTFLPLGPAGGHVVHYFLDFSDALGGMPVRSPFPEPRVGFATVSNVPEIFVDTLGFGFVRRPWDDVHLDPRYPNLGFLDVAHFDPFAFSPQTPLVRWARADHADLGWMARRIARLGEAHVRVAVHAGRLSDPAEEQKLVQILMGRREKILRAAFRVSSPLADVTMDRPDRLCATDLALRAGISRRATTTYTAELRVGPGLKPAAARPTVELAPPDGVCVRLPGHFAPQGAAADSAERYAMLEVHRDDAGARTTLRAYFYDLGASRGWVLVGLARP